MNWRSAALVLACLAGLASPRANAGGRAIWIWEPETYAMLQDRGAADGAIAFLERQGIDCVYLYADAYRGRNLVSEQPALYGGLIRRLRARGIRSFALLGSWHLHTEEYVRPARHADALAMVRRVLQYNVAAAEGERFEGVNLDLEPHLLDEWNHETRVGLLRDFLDLGALLMALKRDLGAKVPIGPAIPFWLDGIALEWHGARKPVSEHVLDTYDYAALMDYRDHAAGHDGIIENARSELDYAAARGKRVVVGVDVSAGEPTKVSFRHLRSADLESALAATAAEYRGNPAFAGFVIHHLEAYRSWLRAQETTP